MMSGKTKYKYYLGEPSGFTILYYGLFFIPYGCRLRKEKMLLNNR